LDAKNIILASWLSKTLSLLSPALCFFFNGQQ